MTNYKQAKNLLTRHERIDISLIQRTLHIPYKEAHQIIGKLLSRNIVEQAEGKYFKQKI